MSCHGWCELNRCGRFTQCSARQRLFALFAFLFALFRGGLPRLAFLERQVVLAPGREPALDDINGLEARTTQYGSCLRGLTRSRAHRQHRFAALGLELLEALLQSVKRQVARAHDMTADKLFLLEIG